MKIWSDQPPLPSKRSGRYRRTTRTSAPATWCGQCPSQGTPFKVRNEAFWWTKILCQRFGEYKASISDHIPSPFLSWDTWILAIFKIFPSKSASHIYHCPDCYSRNDISIICQIPLCRQPQRALPKIRNTSNASQICPKLNFRRAKIKYQKLNIQNFHQESERRRRN